MSGANATCRKCGQTHRGPRSVEQLHAEGYGVLIRANHMPIAEAGEYLRSQWLGGALELAGWCISCAFTEIAATSPTIQARELEKAAATVAAARTPEEIEEGRIGERHICKVLPFDQARVQRAARDLLDITAPKPGGTS